MYYFVNKEEYCQLWICAFHFTLLVCVHFCNQLKDANYKSRWNVLAFWDQEKMMSEWCVIKNFWFCFIFIVWVYDSRKVEKFWFWKSLKYFNFFWLKKNLNMSNERISHIASFPMFGFTLVIILRNFNVENHWNILISFRSKKWRQI